MPRFISPQGNPELWPDAPEGYLTPEEWVKAGRPAGAYSEKVKGVDTALLPVAFCRLGRNGTIASISNNKNFIAVSKLETGVVEVRFRPVSNSGANEVALVTQHNVVGIGGIWSNKAVVKTGSIRTYVSNGAVQVWTFDNGVLADVSFDIAIFKPTPKDW